MPSIIDSPTEYLRMGIPSSSNTDYVVVIKSSNPAAEIVANIPEELSIAVGGEYEARLPSSIADISATAGRIVGVAGKTNAVYQWNTEEIWMNSTPIEIPLTLLFDAETNAFEDVFRPMKILEALTLPTILGGWLISPMAGSNRVTVTVGRQLQIVDAIIQSVASTYSTRLDHNGYPIAGQCEVTIKTPRVLSRDGWIKASTV